MQKRDICLVGVIYFFRTELESMIVLRGKYRGMISSALQKASVLLWAMSVLLVLILLGR